MSIAIGCDGLDLSILNPTQFRLSFDKIPTVEFFCQAISLPEINLAPVTQLTPLLDVFHPGEKITHSPLFATILMDKGMLTYKEIYNWMKLLAVKDGATESFSDCRLIIGANTFVFHDVWPISLAAVNMNIATPNIPTVTFNVSFEYDYYTIE